MIKDDSVFLAHIADAISQIELYTQGLDAEGFRHNRLYKMP